MEANIFLIVGNKEISKNSCIHVILYLSVAGLFKLEFCLSVSMHNCTCLSQVVCMSALSLFFCAFFLHVCLHARVCVSIWLSLSPDLYLHPSISPSPSRTGCYRMTGHELRRHGMR